jgi:hypothetical protein
MANEKPSVDEKNGRGKKFDFNAQVSFSIASFSNFFFIALTTVNESAKRTHNR